MAACTLSALSRVTKGRFIKTSAYPGRSSHMGHCYSYFIRFSYAALAAQAAARLEAVSRHPPSSTRRSTASASHCIISTITVGSSRCAARTGKCRYSTTPCAPDIGDAHLVQHKAGLPGRPVALRPHGVRGPAAVPLPGIRLPSLHPLPRAIRIAALPMHGHVSPVHAHTYMTGPGALQPRPCDANRRR